jgi:hypothetical protein
MTAALEQWRGPGTRGETIVDGKRVWLYPDDDIWTVRGVKLQVRITPTGNYDEHWDRRWYVLCHIPGDPDAFRYAGIVDGGGDGRPWRAWLMEGRGSRMVATRWRQRWAAWFLVVRWLEERGR